MTDRAADPAALGPAALAALAAQSSAWPFEEARKLLARIEKRGLGGKDHVLFETGYGPSGLPHIGTFGEVARTSMVRHAFETLAPGVKTRLLCFSDDMDGMRKIPDTVPDPAGLTPHLQKPLSAVPNPFGGDFDSFAAHNNAMLCRFLDAYGFDYEFASATDYYKAGRFDEKLREAVERHDDIMKVMLPTLGAERQATYSPFLPISPKTGRVLYVPMKHVDPKEGTITFDDEDGEEITLPVTGGRVKLQWKPDFGMRWAALGVDFEMFGKDHQSNAPIYDSICRILGAPAPEHYVYELFLDENGEKISKSRGNGLTIDEWLRYASPQSLSNFMYTAPRKARRLYFDVIPKNVDEYLSHLAAYPRQAPEKQLTNPVWHIHDGAPPQEEVPISFNVLLNLVSASNSEDRRVLWGFISRYVPGATPDNHPLLDELVGYAINYFHDFVKPAKTFRPATEREAAAMRDLSARLAALDGHADAETIQNEVFAVGKEHGFEPLRGWFTALYEVLLGQSQGPRFGSFVALYGIAETRAMIDTALAGA